MLLISFHLIHITDSILGNKSVIAEAIEFFLKKLAVEDIMSVTKLFHVKNVVVFTPREIDEYNKYGSLFPNLCFNK